MRISDLSTFDSKPILWSQLDELLRNKNVTMLGNQANIPSGLVVLDDKGKIPEDADIQHIFYVDNEFPTSGLVKNSLYVSSTGEARATDDNAEYINISLQVVTDFATVSDDTIATSKAIKDYVDTAVTEVATGSSGVLSSYATKEYVDSAVASASGEQHIFYVDALPSIEDAIENSLYVVKGTKEAQIFDGTEYASISLEALTDFSTVTNDTLATTQAISAFVDEKISNIDIPSTDLSNYYTKTEADDKFITSANIPEEVIYTSEFPSSGINNAIYVNDEGQSKIYANNNWIDMSLKVDTEITADAASSVPTTKAVYDLVSSLSGSPVDLTNYNGNVSLHTTNSEQGWMASYFVADGQKIQMEYTNAENNSFAIASSNFIGIGVYKTDGKESIEITNNNISISASNLTYNGFNTNTGNGLVELVDGKIPSGLYDTTNIPDNTLLVESVSDFPTSGTNNTMYIADSSEARVYTDGEWKNISIEVVENFDTPNQTTVPTTQAVKDYVDANAGSGGISSITVGAGLTGNGTSDSPLIVNLSSYVAPTDVSIQCGECTISTVGNFNIACTDFFFNGHATNTPNGLAIVEESGKLPLSIIPDIGSAAPTYTKVTINQSDFSNDDASYTLNGETGGKYYELDGICDVTVTNADGYVIGLDVRYMFDTTKTRLYIPNSLAAGTITNWTIVYLVKTIA